jgi:hypothetical protein
MKSLTSFINIPAFIISLAIGLFFIYIGNNGDERKITVFPTPENIKLLQYRDHGGTCFSFKQKEVTCPANSKDITKIPLM